MDPNSKRPPEPRNSSTTWFGLFIVASLAVCLFLVLSQSQKTLSFSDFERLIAQTKYVDETSEDLVDGYSGEITIETKGRNTAQYIVAKPKSLKISDTEIRGTCFWYEKSKATEDGEPVGTRVNFRSPKTRRTRSKNRSKGDSNQPRLAGRF